LKDCKKKETWSSFKEKKRRGRSRGKPEKKRALKKTGALKILWIKNVWVETKNKGVRKKFRCGRREKKGHKTFRFRPKKKTLKEKESERKRKGKGRLATDSKSRETRSQTKKLKKKKYVSGKKKGRQGEVSSQENPEDKKTELVVRTPEKRGLYEKRLKGWEGSRELTLREADF